MTTTKNSRADALKGIAQFLTDALHTGAAQVTSLML